MNRFQSITAGARALKSAAALALITTVVACSAGGPATTVNQPTTPSTIASYTGPAASTADVQAFKVNLWENIRVSNRCGGCHHEGGQSPMFARSDDVNLAYQAALPLVNANQPDQSTLVLKVSGGHNCWVADPKACGDTMITWIKAWVGAGSSSSTSIKLQAPPSASVGGSKQFPTGDKNAMPPTSGANVAGTNAKSYANTVWPLLTKYCSGCHTSTAGTPQQPYFASSNVDESYAAAQAKMNLDTPALSRFVIRLGTEFHHCWPTPTSGGAPNCQGSSDAMLQAITDFAAGINPTPVDPAMVLSKALKLKDGTIASGGNRFEASLVAKYEFKTGSGPTAYDTSGVNPAADLALSGGVTWVGGWGISIPMGGKAQASTAASRKLSDLIKATGEYSFEVWAAPANVAQMDAYIVSYSGSATVRNATLGQHAMQYEARTRSDKTDTNGKPPLLTAAANRNAQAALQHIVLTYDPVNGQRLYVNGVFTADVDPSKGGSLANWDDTFALVLGNETTGNRQWQGVIKFAAVHSRALTAAQVQQNFAAGVGERYFLLFDVSALSGVNQSYIELEGSQYDNYSYLFNKPTFISLDATAMPSNLPIKGIRVGVNGVEAKSGQSFATVNSVVGAPGYTAKDGQLLSSVGAVIAADKGVDADLFFLSFEQLGTHTHAYAYPTPVPPTMTDSAASPYIGVRPFAQINATMASITGVPITNTAVSTTYNTLQQSLPPAPQIAAFLSSNQTAISQLAQQYCATLVDTQALGAAFFPGLDLSQPAGTYFATAANRNLVIIPLANKAVGTNVNATTYAAVQTELDSLIQKLTARNGTSAGRTAVITKAACTAVLGSGAVSLQ